MMTLRSRLIALLPPFLLSLAISMGNAMDVSSQSSGNYNQSAPTWGGAGNPGGGTGGDTAAINNTHTVTVTAGADAQGDTVTLWPGGTLYGNTAVTDTPQYFQGATIRMSGGTASVFGPNSGNWQVWGGFFDVVTSGSVLLLSNAQGSGGAVFSQFESLTFATAGNPSLTIRNANGATTNGRAYFPNGVTATQDGTITLTAAGSSSATLYCGGATPLTITSGRTLIVAGNITLSTPATGSLAGTLRLTSGTGTIAANQSVRYGTVQVDSTATWYATTADALGISGGAQSTIVLNGGTVYAYTGDNPTDWYLGGNIQVSDAGGIVNGTCSGGGGQTGSTTFNGLEFTGAGNPEVILKAIYGGTTYASHPVRLVDVALTQHGRINVFGDGAANNQAQITGIITGSGTLTKTGLGTLTLSGTNNGTGGITVNAGTLALTGTNNGTGGIAIQGGNVTFNSQAALGAGPVVVQAFGTLTQTAAFNPTALITIQAGGTYANSAAATLPATASITSGSTLTSSGGALALTSTSLPTAGYLRLNPTTAMNITGAYPALTGTLAFAGTGGQNATTSASGNLSSIAGTARTLAFNQTGGGAFNFNGITLNADLIVAGNGNSGLTGMVPTNASGNLGTVTQDANRDLTVALAPTGLVSLTGSTTGWRTLHANSGTVLVNTTDGLGTTVPAQLNGGMIRLNTNLSRAIQVGSNGGGIESFGAARTFSGNISGNGELLVRVVGDAVGRSLTISGNNDADGGNFTGGFKLAIAGSTAGIFFTGTDALGTSGNITIPAGLSFGGTAVTSGTKARFVPQGNTTDAIYDVSNLNPTPDLSSSGLDKDVWIGINGTPISGYTLRDSGSFTTTYRLVTISNTTQNATVFTGGNDLLISTGVVPTDADCSATNVFGTGTLTFSAAQTHTGTTTIRGTVTNALIGGGVQGALVTTSANLSGTSAITVDKGAILSLTGGTDTGASAATVTVKGSSTINANANSPLRDDLILTLGGDSGGGTYASNASGTQTLARLALGAGQSTLAPNAAGKLTLTGTGGGGFTRGTGGVVNINASANQLFTNAPTAAGGSAVAGTSSPILIGMVNAGTVDLVAADTSFGVPTYTTSDATDWSAFADKNVRVGTASTIIGNGTTINSLYQLNAVTLGFAANSNILNIASGMILNWNANAAIGSAVGNGEIRTGNGQDLILYQHTGNTMTVNAKVGQEGGTTTRALTKAGAGSVTLANSANQIGDVYALAGTINVNAAGALGDITEVRTINLMGGAIQFNHPLSTYSQTSLVVGAQGGILGTNNTPGTGSVIQGTTTLNGSLRITANQMQGRIELAGTISGPGDIRMDSSYAQNGDYALLILSGDNTAWTGGLYLKEHPAQAGQLNCHLAKGASAGTGPIVIVSKGANLHLDTNTASDSTYPNDILVNHPLNLIQWSLGPGLGASGGSRATLTGRIAGNSNIIFSGYAIGDTAISELVLAGSVSMSGIPSIPFDINPLTPCNFGTASTTQNLINGQGGLSMGLTTLSLVPGSGPAPRLPVGVADQGALGFIRFSGTRSFIPGAVGPGFVSAIHRAADTVDRTGHFGYLLTATSGTGITYQPPQGKSFLIGSLGPADATLNKQIGGTFGASSSSGTGMNLATMLGGAKHAAGQTLAGFPGGDINIHANAATDTQILKLLVRHSSDTLTLGDGTAANQVVFCPTWGDSGATLNLTQMQKRTGGTTLTKVGAGTLAITDADYIHTDGTSARSGFAWNVTGGTLRYDKDDGAGANFAGFAIGSGCTLSGSGKINGAVTVTSGTISPGNGGPGKLTVGSASFDSSAATFAVDLNGATAGSGYDQLVVANGGTVNLANATLSGSLGFTPAVGTILTIIDNQGSSAVSGTFNGLAQGSAVSIGGNSFTVSYLGGDGNDVTLKMATGNTAPAQVALSTPVNAVAGQEATNGRTLNTRPALIWNVPADVNSDTLHFQVFLDAVDGSTLVADSEVPAQRSAFSWYNGSAWVAMPAGGATASTGQVRWIPPTPLAVGNPFWKVRAYDGSAYGLASAVQRFIIGTRTWTDATLVAGARIRRIHLEELREEIDYARRFRNLNTACVTADPVITPNVTAIRAVHRNELNAGLRAIDAVTGLSGASTLVDAVPGGAIRPLDFTSLRTALSGM